MIYSLIFILTSFFQPAKEMSVHSTPETLGDTLKIPVYTYDELKPLLWKDNDTTYVVNFWATWCVPCVQELPYFVELNSTYKNEAFKLVLVSLDFKQDYLKKLQPFVKEKALESNVVVLEDGDANFWINDIDSTWSGSIPSTLIYKGKERAFYERTFHHADELIEIVKPYLNL